MKTISLKLPDTLDEELTQLAEEKGESKSFLIREALDDYLSRQRPRPGKSFLERARHLIGSVEGGPEDLSYNKTYLDDYGR